MSIKSFLLLPLLPLLLSAQAADGQGSAAPSSEGSIEGRVLNALTGEPVAKAAVSTLPFSNGPAVGAPSAEAAAVTDASGRFLLTGVRALTYALTAAKIGFFQTKGVNLSVESGQRVTGVEIRMTPAAVVIGRVVDEDGDPLVRASVRLWRLGVASGRRRVEPVTSESTNDLGEYRIFNVEPGRYYLSATIQGRNAPNAPEQDYGAAYYPGVADRDSAQLLNIRAGERFEGINLALRKTRIFRVNGRVSGAQEDGNVMLTMNPVGSNSAAPPIINSFANRQTGVFGFRGVTPGSYMVTARELRPGSVRTAKAPVEVSNADVEDLGLTLASPLVVTGRLRMDGPDRLPEQMPITLSLRDQGRVAGDIPVLARGAGATFQIQNAAAEAYVLQTTSRAAYVKGVRVGSAETALPILDLSNGAPAGVEIVLGPNPPQVTGSVMDAGAGEPAANALVVLVPNEPDRRNVAQFYRQVRADASGRFGFAPLLPGSYKAYAWPDPNTAAYMEPDFMKDFEGKGVGIEVYEGQKLRILLNLLTVNPGSQ